MAHLGGDAVAGTKARCAGLLSGDDFWQQDVDSQPQGPALSVLKSRHTKVADACTEPDTTESRPQLAAARRRMLTFWLFAGLCIRGLSTRAVK